MKRMKRETKEEKKLATPPTKCDKCGEPINYVAVRFANRPDCEFKCIVAGIKKGKKTVVEKRNLCSLCLWEVLNMAGFNIAPEDKKKEEDWEIADEW